MLHLDTVNDVIFDGVLERVEGGYGTVLCI
jgi:hypothetical protein